MYEIIKRKELNPTVTLLEINAPLVAKKAEPGQFIILRVDDEQRTIGVLCENNISFFDEDDIYKM